MELYRNKIKSGREGCVYIIHAQGTQRYKVGRSTNPITRWQTIKKQSPYPIKMVDFFYTPDAITDEYYLHQELKDYRVHGEWFEDLPGQEAVVIGTFSSYTNKLIENDAKTILKQYGVDTDRAIVAYNLSVFLHESLEMGWTDMFWNFIEKQIPLDIYLNKPDNVEVFVAGLLQGVAFGLSLTCKNKSKSQFILDLNWLCSAWH